MLDDKELWFQNPEIWAIQHGIKTEIVEDIYCTGITKDEYNKIMKAQSNQNKENRKRKKISNDSLDLESKLNEEDDIFELSDNAKKWARKSSMEGRKIIFKLISDLETYKIPTIEGSSGITLKEKVYLKDILPFLEFFMPKNRRSFKVKSNYKSWPFTGEDHLQMVWDIKSLEELNENVLFTFKNLHIATETMWIHHPFQQNIFNRYDDPINDPEISYFFEDSNEAREKILNYNMVNFEMKNSRTKRVGLVVGNIPNGKKRICSFRITFTRNWKIKDRFVGGWLQIRFFHEVRDGGAIKGGFANGKEKEEEKGEIDVQEALSSLKNNNDI